MPFVELLACTKWFTPICILILKPMYRKFPNNLNKGAGREGKTLGGAPIRENTFPACSGVLQNENRTIIGWDMAKKQNLCRLVVKRGGALIGDGALNGEFT